MSPLNRKLLRDLYRIKGQVIAIGVIIAVGVLLLVMMTGLVTSLDETRRTYYQRYRLADIFAPVNRAPDQLIRKLGSIPGVSAVEGRVIGRVLINLPQVDVPVQAQAVSLPDVGTPRLNDYFLTDGRRPEPNRSDEILLLHSFARANRLQPGSIISVTMNGKRRNLRVVGLAQSPEFLYTSAPGELITDDARFGVIWMGRTPLGAAYDMEGAFNEALLSIGPGENPAAVIRAVDQVLEPYGGVGAYGLEDQLSNRYVSEEIDGLRASSSTVPPIFLSVAAFLLYIVISRLVESEREQIGLIKAFGYTDLEVGLHYFKLIMIITLAGAASGCFLGIISGRAMIDLYLEYYKFPFLIFKLKPTSFLTGFLISVGAASAGGIFVLKRVFSLTPAVAMQPPAPPDYSRIGRFGRLLNTLLDQPSRMVLRRILYQPLKMTGAMLGIAAGVALTVSMIGIMQGFEHTIDLTFNVIDRSNVTVTFNEAISKRAVYELQSLPGVLEVEPVRVVPVVLRNGLKSHRGAITGLVPEPRLNRAVDSRTATIQLSKKGIVLAKPLATILAIGPGEMLTVEIREGRRGKLTIPVAGVADTFLGSPAYMQLKALNRALLEPERISGAYLRVDADRAREIYRALKDMPVVAGVSLKDDARLALQKQMDEGAGLTRYIMAAIAAIISFGIIYNSARIAYAERLHDLASLMVIGFNKGEVAFVLLGELALITLVAIPVGSLLGYYLSFVISTGFSSDLYQIPVVFNPESYGVAATAVLLAACVSGWFVKKDLDRVELVSALKVRE